MRIATSHAVFPLSAVLALAATASAAQTAPPAAETTVQEVVVTGSRIARTW